MQSILFIAKDPLNNEVKLLKETFEKHILIRHPEIRGKIGYIRQTIENPLYIGLSANDRNSLVYLSKFFNRNIPYIVVAAKKVKKFNKIILTAFSTKNLSLNKLNKILWQTKKQKGFIILTHPQRKK